MAAIRDGLARHEHHLRQPERAWAATAMVLHDHPVEGPRILFIKRAARPGDRWSGQMALPGGKRDDTDRSLVDTARRETLEEVGVVLEGPPVGRLRDVGSRMQGGYVATFAWEVPTEPTVTPEPTEVSDHVWIPVRAILDPANAARFGFRGLGPFPAIEHDGYTVWGLTHRILGHLATVLGTRLPRPRR